MAASDTTSTSNRRAHASLRQIFIVSAINLRSLKQRPWASLVVVVGMACVIGVLLSMLSLTEGLMSAYDKTGDPRRALVVSAAFAGKNRPTSIGFKMSTDAVA